MDPDRTPVHDQRHQLIALHDTSMHEVYGYLVARCGSATVAEDLTSETFLAAAAAVHERKVPHLTVAWLIGVARHKLVDHWRRVERHERRVAAVADDPATEAQGHAVDWDVRLDAMRTRATLESLGAHHRAALTLRYLDGLSVPETATILDRTVHATETLLVRARRAFRHAYEATDEEVTP